MRHALKVVRTRRHWTPNRARVRRALYRLAKSRLAVWLLLSCIVAAGYSIGELRSPYPSAGGALVAGHGFWLCRMPLQRNCVIDGDTIRHDGIKVRLSDIDAPEISSPRCASEAAAGHRAKARLLELINAGPIRLVHRSGPDTDRYGRKLRVVERNGRSLGDILVAEGLVRHWSGGRRSWCG